MAKEIVVPAKSSPPRVRVSFSRKYNVAQYESLDVHVGAEDDCKPDEDINAGFDRVIEDVQAKFEELCGKIEGNKKGGKR